MVLMASLDVMEMMEQTAGLELQVDLEVMASLAETDSQVQMVILELLV